MPKHHDRQQIPTVANSHGLRLSLEEVTLTEPTLASKSASLVSPLSIQID